MNKILKNIFVFASISVFLVGCRRDKQEEQVEPKQEAEIIRDKYIVNNSHSEYSIVIPKKYNSKEKTAADTLSEYLKKSSGAKLNIVTDNELASNAKYISLGNTSVFNANFGSEVATNLTDKISSYFISTKNDNIYIYSNPNERGEATVFGVYDLLHELINYEYYAADEIYYTNEKNINLRGYKDFYIHPSFDGRSIGNYHLIHNQDICDNFRIINQYRGNEWVSEIYGHSQVTKFVRPQDMFDETRTVHEAHPDWFSNRAATVAETTNNQLCWSAGEELVDYVAKRFIEYFIKYPSATYFMFGQEDNHTAFCRCERCQKAMKDYAVNYAGLQIILMNKVIEKTNAWLAENEPGRQVRYVVFAYYATKEAPCVQKDGKWVPANDLVVPHKDLYIFFAPISCNFAYPLDNTYFNSDTYLQLKQWNEVAGGHVIMYLYDVNFRYYFANFANFGSVKSMYQTCKDLGVSYIYTQGATDTVTCSLNHLREYVESKLMWNLEYGYEELAKDFIDHYYYDAASEIYEYYQSVRDRLAQYHTEKGDGGAIYTTIASKAIYPYALLRYFTTLFDQAMEKISKYQESNIDLYNTLKTRIMEEYLSVIYLKMTLAKAEISEEEKAKMKEIFTTYTNYLGIARASEGGMQVDPDELFA